MNALVVYYTRFGHTRSVAEAIAERLQSAGSVDVIGAERVTAQCFDGIDLLVVGTPTHVANLPKELRSILDGLPKGALKGVRIAAFDTSYRMNWFVNLFTAAKPLCRKLRQLGGKQLVSSQSFFVVEKEGPLHEGEMERARTWAGAILVNYRRFSEHR